MMEIGGCRACETCFSTGKACTFDDDFNKIAPAILEADALVFTMPVYWYSIPAQIKGVIDRIYSLVGEEKTFPAKNVLSSPAVKKRICPCWMECASPWNARPL